MEHFGNTLRTHVAETHCKNTVDTLSNIQWEQNVEHSVEASHAPQDWADGLGGHAAGEVASRTAVEGLVKFIEATRAGPSEDTWPVPFDPHTTLIHQEPCDL
mgnify:CR=1 FL=1